MAGRRYCPFEGEYVPRDEMEVVDGTLVHTKADPPHRVTDGMTVRIGDGGVVVDAVAALESMADAMPDDHG